MDLITLNKTKVSDFTLCQIKSCLLQVRDIFLKLKNGIFQFNNKYSGFKEILLKDIERLEFQIHKIEADLFDLRNDETYLFITSILDWDEYFESTKAKFEKEIQDLECKGDSI